MIPTSNALNDYDLILILSYGGPQGPEDVMPFMRNATRGRGVPDSRLAVVSVHYNKFDGVSPIVARNQELLTTLEVALRATGCTTPIVQANRNMRPYVVDVLREAHAQGARKILYMPTSAFDSYSGCRQYREDLAEAANTLEAEGLTGFTFTRTPPFYGQPGFVEANALAVIDGVREAAAALWPPVEDEQVTGDKAAEPTVVFVTHSIPIPMAEASGTGMTDGVYEYDRQHVEVYEQVMARVNEARGAEVPWVKAYCSRSGNPNDPWQEPDIEQVINDLHAQGVRRVVVSPVGFIYDHMEVVYDLDIEVTEVAGELGMVFKRARTPGLHPAFIEALRLALVQAASAPAGSTDAAYRSNMNTPTSPAIPAVCEREA